MISNPPFLGIDGLKRDGLRFLCNSETENKFENVLSNLNKNLLILNKTNYSMTIGLSLNFKNTVKKRLISFKNYIFGSKEMISA